MMLRRCRWAALFVGSVVLSLPLEAADEPAAPPAAAPAPPPAAAGEAAGQADLNEAIEAKITVSDLDDFGRVLELCKRALDKGLDADSKKFAEALYTSTLIDRAAMLASAVLDREEADPQWRRIRGFALRDLAEVEARDPGIGSVRLMIARLEMLPGGNRERAAAEAKKAIELLGDDRLQQAQAHLVLAEVEVDPEAKGRHLDEAIELSPRDAHVRRARGVFLLMQDKFEQAREDLAVAAEEDPDDAGTHEGLGLAFMMAEKFDDALAAFDRAVELRPDAPGPLLQRARLHALQDHRELALADVDRVIDLVPQEPSPRILRARIQIQADEPDLALADVEAVLADDAEHREALEIKGLIAAERRDYAEAIRSFRMLVRKDPDDVVLLSQLGMLFLADKQPLEAIRRFTRALDVDAENFPSRRGRSDAEISIGDHGAALADLEKAHALKPDDTGVLNNLAWLLATSPDDAIRNGARAIELATKACEKTEWKQPHIISTLAAGYAETGDFDTARKYSRQAVEGEEAEEMRAQLRKELESYEVGKPWRERQEEPESGRTVASSEAGAGETQPREPREPRRPFDD